MNDGQQVAAPRILVVEDDAEMIELMQNMLSLVRCDVQIARSGEEALSRLRQESENGREIDLVLLDIMVPGMDGYEVVARVKADPVLRNTAIIMTTALDSVSDKTLGLGLGADDYLTKPFDPQELLARIDAVMRIRRSEQAVRRRNEELSALIEINRVVTSSLELDQVLEATIRGIREILHVEAGSLVLVDEETGGLVFSKTFSPERGWVTGRTIQPGEGIVGYVVESGEPKLVNNVDLDPHFMAEVDDERGFTSQMVLCVPLKIRDRVIGAIEVINKLDDEFTQQDLELLQAMAASVAVALDNASLYSELADFAEELERSQAQLVQAEKMAAIGRLTASIAHEINNPLQAIHNSLHLSLHRQLEEEKRVQYLGMAQTEVQRLIEIVQRMLDFYRPSRGGQEPTDVNSIAQNVLALAHKRLQHGDITVHTRLGENLPLIPLVSDQIIQVFLNIVINAVEAMPAGGELLIETRLSADQEWVLICFRDTGSGMSSEQIANLFEPFYTTKSDGTGLGLAISYGIIERHGGEIEVSSRSNEGTLFVVRLPAGGIATQGRMTF
ncbi:MAG TPA: response regulator [Chloroflexi bacterium]|nr:response regulator [Chloroflexota bacterium]